MDDFLIVGKTQSDTSLYMSELSSQTLSDNGLQAASSGLYLYEASEHASGGGIRVLASVADADAAYRLMDLIGARQLA